MDDPVDPDRLLVLIHAALREADRHDETLVSCFLAQAIDAIERRPDRIIPTHP